ncbi:hypothetical protein Trad_0888 [Truepera radiovictrix DSM 17093]|uniref:Uncharacterized protein n=2 Tax=Truepera TaxID=332248 RepID=D7CUN1_TRURR|nr:hypothetical protein Trad_0888 [Truepera radiovictrix DSM 17093]
MTPFAALLLLAFLWLVLFVLLLWGLLAPRRRDQAPTVRARRHEPPTPVVRTVRAAEPPAERPVRRATEPTVYRTSVHRGAARPEPSRDAPRYDAETDEATERPRSRDDEAFERFWRPRDDLEF